MVGLDIEPLYLRQAHWAAERFGMTERLHFMAGDVYELLRTAQPFDLVWFTGVFYHLRYPLLALDLVRRATRRLMMFQTMTMPGDAVIEVPEDLDLDERETLCDPGWPKMAFIEKQLAADASNWWAPSHACVEALLRSAGFRILARPEHEFYLCAPIEQPQPDDLTRVAAMVGGQ
jgi:tRNA (mo5U34)-methyltransferase